MKNIFMLLLAVVIATASRAQKIKVTEASEVVDKIPRSGLATVIELDEKEVDKLWYKQLKSYGKVESSKGVYTIASANIPEISSTPCRVVSIVKSSGKGTQVWWDIDLGETHVTSSNNSSAHKAAEKILHDFAVQCYTEDINEQIKDAEKALNTTVKAQEKEVKEGEQLVRDVEKNKQEKANLEQKLKQNADEAVQLQKDIQQNKTDQQTAQQDVEKMKKALEVVKQKLNYIDK